MKKILLPFDEAKIIVREYGFQTMDEYDKWQKKNKDLIKKLRLPAQPFSSYKDVWTSSEDFFGKTEIITFEKAKRIIKKYNLNSKTYVVWARKNPKLRKKLGLPSSPYKYYSKEWTTARDFFSKPLLDYDEAKKIVLKMGIKTSKEYAKLFRTGKLPNGMPSNPHTVYSKEKMVITR